MKKQLFMAAMMPAFLIGCSKDDKPSKPSEIHNAPFFSTFEAEETKTLTITSIDGTPLSSAKILIGEKIGSPFVGNYISANAQGEIVLPKAWTQTEALTIDAPGYLRATYLLQEPATLTVKLRPLPTASAFEVAGLTQGHSVVDKDGYIDFGLVIPAMSKMDILSFNMDSIISPQDDIISTAGQKIKIPSNVTLPRQKESYGIFPVTLEKPNYRVFFTQPGVVRVFAARGRFPFRKVVDELRNDKKFQDLINDFHIQGGGIRDIEIVGQKSKLDIPIKELNFSEKRALVAPDLTKGQLFLSVGVTEQSGYMVPTDVKRIKSGQSLDLSVLPGAPAQVLSILKNENEMSSEAAGADRLSATLLPFTAGLRPTMLPLIPNPSLNGPKILQIPAVQTIQGVSPIATYSLLSRIEEKGTGKDKTKTLHRYWEIYGAGWKDQVVLPEWPSDLSITGKRRWEVTLVGSQTSSLPVMGPAMIDSATHVTHSSIEF